MEKHAALKTTLFICFSFIANTAAADFFIGASGGKGSMGYDEKIEILGVTQSSSDSSELKTASFRIGTKSESSRGYLNWENLSYTDATVSIVTFSNDSLYGRSEYAKLLLGLSVGMAKVTWETDDPLNTGINWGLKDKSASSLTLGARLGALIPVGAGADLEIVYSIYGTNLQTKLDAGIMKYDFTISRVSNAMVGININF